MARILVVDDEPGMRGMLEVVLRRDGHEVSLASDGGEALAIAATAEPVLMLTDLRMDGLDGLGLLAQMRAKYPRTLVVVMTAYAEWDTAVRAMRQGAYSFLRKPFDNAELRSLIRRALAAHEHLLAAEAAGESPETVTLIGTSPEIRGIQELIDRVSTTDATILVTGESGTGKELIARAVHYGSLRSDRPLVRINSGALSPSLLESELFGHVRGAFTGAIADRPGLFALADGGTLFLDEVGELATETQVKLLRVLESGEFIPVGGSEIRRCDVRIVAATNRDLNEMVQAGSFREDLYYRLAVIAVELPPLRRRRDDIPLLAGHLLARHAVRLRRGLGGFTEEAMEALMVYPWPGNIRELDNRIQRGVALTESGDITDAALFGDLARSHTDVWNAVATARRRRETGRLTYEPGDANSMPGAPLEARDGCSRLNAGEIIDLAASLEATERALIAAALRRSGDNLTEAARLLGISFRQIRYRVRQLGLR